MGRGTFSQGGVSTPLEAMHYPKNGTFNPTIVVALRKIISEHFLSTVGYGGP